MNAFRIAVTSAIALLAVSVFLIGDQIAAMRRVPFDEARIEALEERVKTDAAVAVELEAERERQTARSLAREKRNRRLGYGLLLVAVVFIVAAKWRETKRSEPASFPPLKEGGSRGDFRRQSAARRKAPLTPQPGAPLFQRGEQESEQDELDLSFVDDAVAREGRGREAVIPILQAVQEYYGYLPEEALRRVAEATEATPAQIAGVASFYARFRHSPVGRHMVRVCHGTACHVAGVGPIMDELRRRLGIAAGADTDPARHFTLDPVACLGCCSLAPVMMVDDDVAGHLTPVEACEALQAAALNTAALNTAALNTVEPAP